MANTEKKIYCLCKGICFLSEHLAITGISGKGLECNLDFENVFDMFDC